MRIKISEQFFKSCLFLTINFLLLATSINIQAQSSSKATREQLMGEFNKAVGCFGTGKCLDEMSRPQMRAWLLNNPTRIRKDEAGKTIEDRRGNPTLNYDDFVGFRRVYGNAIGKYRELSIGDKRLDDPILVRGFVFNDDPDQHIVVQYNPDLYFNGKPTTNLRTEGSIDDFLDDFYPMFKNNGSGISQSEFVNFMLSKQ